MRPMDERGGGVGAVFAALSEPTRRALVAQLTQGEKPVSELAQQFDVSLPAISQHLKVLKEAGLVTARREGRQQIYAFRPEALDEALEWMRQHAEQFWRSKLGALGEYLDTKKRGD